MDPCLKGQKETLGMVIQVKPNRTFPWDHWRKRLAQAPGTPGLHGHEELLGLLVRPEVSFALRDKPQLPWLLLQGWVEPNFFRGPQFPW